MEEYENPWLFDNKPFTSENIGKYAGFVYIIYSKVDERAYIGRKYFWEIRKTKGKKRRQRRESNWKEYYGSCKELTEEIEKHGKERFVRIIFSLHKTRGDCNYEEVKQQFLNNVLEDDGWFNENINGKWIRKPRHIVEDRRYNEHLKKYDIGFYGD